MIYVFTAVHDRYKITEKFVDLLLRQTYKDIQLVLVDDGCTDGTADMVRSKMPDAVIIQGDGNLWWGGAPVSTVAGFVVFVAVFPAKPGSVFVTSSSTKVGGSTPKTLPL